MEKDGSADQFTGLFITILAFFVEMFRKIFAIVSGIIAGGLGIAILGTGTQVAHAGISAN